MRVRGDDFKVLADYKAPVVRRRRPSQVAVYVVERVPESYSRLRTQTAVSPERVLRRRATPPES
jgi:hypothetical protein